MFAATSAATNVTPSKRDHCAAFPSWVIMWRGGMSMNYVCESAGFVHTIITTQTHSPSFILFFLYIWSQFMQQEKEKRVWNIQGVITPKHLFTDWAPKETGKLLQV